MKENKLRFDLLFLTAAFMIILVSCNPAKKYEEEEKAQIRSYLNSNPTMNFELKPSGLYYLEVITGSGRSPVTHDTTYIKYIGKYLDGIVFDTNVGGSDTLSFPFDEDVLIPGIEEGISYMKQGGKATLLIPSFLAYGATGWYIIPGYTPLLFDIELVRVKPGSGK
jgi:FKBP-type peptidyl-prolyl cis-trans isomerase FkpA